MRRFFLLVAFFVSAPSLIIISAFFFLFLSTQGKNGFLGLDTPENKAIAYAALPSNLNVVSDSISIGDSRIGKVSNFFQEYNSPLTQYAEFIVITADKYDVDYRLVPAIAAQESGACHRIISGVTYNCWGFGIYGKKKTSFTSYESAIDTITRYFAKKKSNGIETLDELGTIYNPTDHNNWKQHIALFMAQL